jgi:hypothetical protein
MSRFTRRTFLGQLGAAAMVPAAGHLAGGRELRAADGVAQGSGAAQAASSMFDLLIQGGRVIDPSQ